MTNPPLFLLAILTSLLATSPTVTNKTDKIPKLSILYQTEHLAVVAKPPLVPCHWPERRSKGKHRRRIVPKTNDPNEQSVQETNIIQRATATFDKQIYLVHRLDAATSGCLLVAFSSQACREASQALAAHGEKTYYALCRGDGATLKQKGTYVADGNVKDAKGVMRTAATEIECLLGSNGPPRRCCLVRRNYKCANTDGIDIDSCENVLVEYNYIDVGDDHVTILAGKLRPNQQGVRSPPTRNVTVQHNDLKSGMGLSIGSSTAGGIEDVLYYNNVMTD